MAYLGMCVFSQEPGATASAVFDHVSLQNSPLPLLDNGLYTIGCISAPDLVLDAAGAGTADGTVVDIATPTATANQKWLFTSRGQGVYDIQPSYDTTLAMSVAGAGTDNGTRVVLEKDKGAKSQLWAVVLNPNGTYSLLPQCVAGKGLDDLGGNKTPGFRQDIWAYNAGDPHLQWAISPAE
jgi:hypothetical protein